MYMSEVAEDIVVSDFVKPTAMTVLDCDQYSLVLKSSTTVVLLSMIHHWTAETHGNGSTIRSLFPTTEKHLILSTMALSSINCAT